MKKITSVPVQDFTVNAKAIESIEVEIRKILNLYPNNLSQKAIELLNALGQNLYGIKYDVHFNTRASHYDTHPKAVWLLNMMSNCTSLMNTVINANNRHIFYKLFTEIQQLGGNNLANTTVAPHSATCLALNLTTYYVYEMDFFAMEFAEMTLAYVRTYYNPGSKIFILNDLNTKTYRMGTTDDSESLMNWKHLYGGMNGFLAIKYYLSEQMRQQFRHTYSAFYEAHIGYIPTSDQLREYAFVPTCKLKKLKNGYNNKPIYTLAIA